MTSSPSPPADLSGSYAHASDPSSSEHEHEHEHEHDRHRDRSASPLVLYRPPTALSLLRTAAINLLLPFINGLMLGFGELFAHEIAFRLGWGTTRVFPSTRLRRPAGPGVEVRENPAAEKGRNAAGRLEDLASLE